MQSYQRYNRCSLIYLVVRYVVLTGIHLKKKKKKKCHANWLISENANEVIEHMLRRKRHRHMGWVRSPMWLTASRQTALNSTVNRQKSLFFYRQPSKM